VGDGLEEDSPPWGRSLMQSPHGPLNASDLVVTIPDAQVSFAKATSDPTDGAKLLMLIPVGEAGAAAGGLNRLTCKGKGRTMGFPSGPPPTPKLDEIYFE
jgi:hypothetical protein